MRIKYQDGRNHEVKNEDAAMTILGSEFPDEVYGDWEQDTPDRRRMLVWENEEIAGELGTGDDGSHAIAAILKVEEVA